MAFLIVDLDNTLVDRVTAFCKWATRFLEVRGLDPLHIDELVALDDDGLRRRPSFFQLASEVVDAYPAEVIRDDYLAKYPASFVLDEAVASALSDLREAGHVVVIATNGPPFQEDVIRFTGLDRLVDGWAVSEIEGYRKPDIRIVERLKSELFRNDAELIVIGDGVADIELAHNLKARSVWIDRARNWDEELGFSPSRIAGSVVEALHVVGSR